MRPVRTRGGNTKLRALRLDSGMFAWGAEGKYHFGVVLKKKIATNTLITYHLIMGYLYGG